MKIKAHGILDVQTYSNTWGTDYAKAEAKKGGLSYDRLQAFLGEILEQPSWRARADQEADYYDSNQLDSETLVSLRSKGIPPIIVNMVAPTINMVLGLEAKTRTDWVVKPENDQYEEAAQAMSQKLKEAERMSGADRAISEAYASQVKVGLGWVEVGFNRMNPFGYRHRCEFVHRREIWWDWHDDDAGLSKARYLVRRKWYDEDVACAYFPQNQELIRNAINGWANFDPTHLDTAEALYMDMEHERDFTWGDEEWRDTLRKRVCIYEVWYRTVTQGFVIRYKNGKVVEFDEKNPVHNAAVMAGIAEIEATVIPKMRLSFWIGPHRMVDMPTPLPHQEFPYVPFWGFREDRTGVPYGMIRAMRPLQDEVNARRSKMLWQLSARTVFVDEDGVTDHKKTQQEIARPDAYVKVNTLKGKYPIESRIKVQDNSSLTSQQFEVYQDSKQSLNDAVGVHAPQLGNTKGSADSGIAISQLIDQGTTTLAEINDNLGTGRMLVGQRLLAQITDEMKGKPESIKMSKFGEAKRVKFNEPKVDEETGLRYMDNDITRMQMSVVLADMPQTPTYRMQQFMQLTDMVKTLPEQVQMAVIDIVINASDIPDKQEVLKRLRDTLGLGTKPPEDMTPEEQQQAQAQQQEAAEMKAMQKQLAQAQADLETANVALTNAKTELTTSQADALAVEAGLNPELSRDGPGPDEVRVNSPGLSMAQRAAGAPPPPTTPQPPQPPPGLRPPPT